MLSMRNFMLYLVFGSILAGLSMKAWSGDDHENARRLMEQGDILPLEAILQKIPENVDRVLEVELEREQGRMVYEIEILNVKGHVKEYVYDAKNGRLLNVEDDD